MTPEDIHLLWGNFLFLFVCIFRDLPDDRSYLPDNKRHLTCVLVRFHANIAKAKKNTHFYNLQKPTPHEYPFWKKNIVC